MKKIDETVLKETKYIAAWVLILSMLMQSVFLIIGKWDVFVLLGNLLGGTVAVLNFLFMGITVQHALEKDEKDAKSLAKLSQIYRNFFLLIVLVIGILLPCFNTWSTVIPIFFPRFSIFFRPLFDKKRG